MALLGDTAAERVQKHETVPDKHLTENMREVLECEPELNAVLPRRVAFAVIEYDRRKWTATRGRPQKTLQLKTTTGNLDSSRWSPFSDLREPRRGNRNCRREQEESAHGVSACACSFESRILTKSRSLRAVVAS